MLALTFAATVHISVLGAFHPVQFELRPALGSTLFVETEGRTAVLKDGATMLLTGQSPGPVRVTGQFGSPARFFLSIPGSTTSGKVEREYFGRLELRRTSTHQLQAIVEMDVETAVASIVEAEGTTGLPFEARRAQAVATRSYLLAAAGKRHIGYDFCDQDHCQYLKDVPPETTPASKATASTRSQVLVYKGNVVAALYSANCGGHTRDLHEAGWQEGTTPAGTYPYYGVSCPLGGTVSGHRVGMCQLGAIQIARQGKTANVILAHYFPGTQIGLIGGTTAVRNNSVIARHSTNSLGGDSFAKAFMARANLVGTNLGGANGDRDVHVAR
jgi:peptidoglycan hydrolase-like amidase